MYPRRKYHKKYGSVRVVDEAEEKSLGPGWEDSYACIPGEWDENNPLLKAREVHNVLAEMKKDKPKEEKKKKVRKKVEKKEVAKLDESDDILGDL